MSDIALQADGLTVNYDRISVLWDISFAIPKGNIVGIIGPNGAGKTTLLKVALGIEKPLSGKITFFNQSVGKVIKKIAYVPQKESIDWDFPITVEQVVMMGRYGRLGLFRRPKKIDCSAVKNALELVGLAKLYSKQIAQLSGGQQQKLFIARALVQDPEIYLLDEPFSGVDITTEKEIMNLLRKLCFEGKTIFIIHHDLNTVEEYFDWLIMLNTRLVAYGPVDSTFTKENIRCCFGKNFLLLDEVAKLSQNTKSNWKL